MRKFIKKISLFLIILILIIIVIDVFSMILPFNGYIAKITNSSTDRVGSGEIEPRIAWVQQEDNSKNLLLGDSVGNQLFINLRGINEEWCIATSNAGIMIPGQYILMREYVRCHRETENVFLVINPFSLYSNVNTRLSYQYFVMPFVGNGYSDYLSDNMKSELKEKFHPLFLTKPMIKCIDYSCINRKIYLNAIYSEEQKKDVIPDYTLEYLNEFIIFCKENNINFYLIPAPIADTQENHVRVQELSEQFEKHDLDKIFTDFLEEIQYYPAEQFYDGTHFAEEYAKQDILNEKIYDIIYINEKYGILDNVIR